jgi:type IV secretory pathway VirB10-like protein
MNEGVLRSPKWLRNIADFEINTGEDIKGEPSLRRQKKLDAEKKRKEEEAREKRRQEDEARKLREKEQQKIQDEQDKKKFNEFFEVVEAYIYISSLSKV